MADLAFRLFVQDLVQSMANLVAQSGRGANARLTVGKLKASDVLPSHSTLCAWSVRFAFEMALSVGRWNPEVD